MKQRLSHFSKSTLSVILSVCMLVSCLTVGLIATDAAQVTSENRVGASVGDDESVGWTAANCYMHYSADGGTNWVNAAMDSEEKITLTLYSETTIRYFLVAESTWYRYNGYYTDKPSGTSTSSDSFYARISGTWNNHTTSDSNYIETTLPSGVYTITYETRYNYSSTSNVTLKYHFYRSGDAETQYAVTISAGTGGSVTSDKSTAPNGDTVTLSNTPNPGYAFGSYTVTKTSDGTDVTATVLAGNTITMPDYDITVSATFNAVHSYYITSAGATDSDKGFTNSTAWAETQLTEPSGTAYTQVYDNVPMGWYRFKVKDYYGSSVDHIYGGAYTTYTDNSDTNTRIPTANRSAENNGNAKFYLSAKSKLTVTFDSDTGGITVTASTPTDSADEYEYYVVGMYSDGTEGMFGNVWADDWKTYSSADKMTETSTGVWTKTYTSFGGSYGTYSYKIVKVNKTTGTYEAYDNAGGSGANLTVDIPDGTTSAVFTFDSTKATASQVSCTVSAESGWQPGDPGVSSYTVQSKYVQWSVNDNYSSTGSNKGTINAYYETGNNSIYYADLTAVAKAKSSFYLYLSNNSRQPDNTTNYQDALGTDSGNTFNGKTDGETVYYNTTQKVYKVSKKQNTGISGNKEYAKIEIEDKSKIVAFGVKMTFDSSGNLDYSFYYNVKGSGGGTDPTYVNNVDIYAKSACLRDGTYNRFADLAKTEVVSITTPDGIVRTSANWLTGKEWKPYTENNKYSSKYGYEKVTGVPIGSKVKLRTTLSPAGETFTGSTQFKDSHYLKAYSFNGYTYELHTKNDTGVYEEEWTAEAINTTYMKDGQTVEINPIYYLKDNTYTKTFFIDGYEGLLSEKWGTLLCVYPYYKGSSNKANAFGGYPGQPMLYWGGKYQMEIPLTHDGTATGKEVKGLTMHNAYWDLLHRKLDTKCDDGHCQSYDYDDFYKIYKEKNADTIFFRYKYYPKENYTYNGSTIPAGHDNFGDNYSYDNHSFQNSSLNTAQKCVDTGNGVEIVTDYYGRQIDVFSTLLTDSQKSTYNGTQTKELLLVSTGYKNTYEGHYATEWAVYAPSTPNTNGSGDTANKFIGYISSSMLYLNSFDRVKQYTGGTNSGDGQMSSSKYKSTYEHLKKYYEGVPALISYEKEIHNYSLDQADRSDGKWYYSTSSDRVSANIKIQVTAATTDVTLLGDHNWTDSAFTTAGAGNVVNVDGHGNSAYFTNTTPEYLYGQVSVSDIIADPSKMFTFQATSGNGYQFVGWVRESDGKLYQIADKDGLGSSNISANDTYIARFMPAATGSLVISHNIVKDATHKGDGTKYLKVEVLDSTGNTVKKTIERTDGSDVDVSKYITSGSTDKIRITLTTDPDEDCQVDTRSVNLGADSKYDKYKTDLTTGLPKASAHTTVITVTAGSIYTDGVTALRYTTMLTKTAIDYAYRIIYTYTSRFWGEQKYMVEGFIEDELLAAKYFSGVKTTATLTKDFIVDTTPYEKNFRQKINWDYNNMTNNAAGAPQRVTIGETTKENTYLMTAFVGSANEVDDTVRAEFFLPYKYDPDTKASTGLAYYDASGNLLTGDNAGTAIAFDESSYESATVKSQAGHLFNYDNTIPPIPTEQSVAGDEGFQKLIYAAPYVYKGLTASDYVYYYQDSIAEFNGRYEVSTGVYLTASDTVSRAQWYTNSESSDRWFDGTTADKTYAKIIGEGDSAKLVIQYVNQTEGEEPEYTYVEVTRTKVPKGVIKANLDAGIAGGTITKEYFTRWDIFTADGAYVTSSFSNTRVFNYSGYEDYIIIPVYDSSNNSYYIGENDQPIGISALRAASITYMGDTRNQWNYDSGNYQSVTGRDDATEKGDKLLVDFGLAFNNMGERIHGSTKFANGTIKVGMVIERLDKLDNTAGGTVTDLGQANAITGEAYYAKKYNTTDVTYKYNAALTTEYVKAKITGQTISDGNGNRPKCSKVYYCNTTKLDFLDRVQYTYTFTQEDNNSENSDANNTAQGQYVYRAVSYIYDGGEVALSDPIYFTLYDLASR